MAACALDWSALGTWLTALVAGAALWVARDQLKASREAIIQSAAVAREMAALGAWREYLTACFNYPEFSSSDLAKRPLKGNLTRVVEQLTPESERYLWFISILLNSCEQVLLGMERSTDWWETMADQIGYHEPVISQFWPRWQRHYDSTMNELVLDGLTRGDA